MNKNAIVPDDLMKKIGLAARSGLRNLVTLAQFWKPGFLWLYRNRFLRMDANETVSDKNRRLFHIDRYEFAAAHLKGSTGAGFRILDAACGTGYGSDILRKTGAAVITGIDIDPEAVAYANRKYGGRGCGFQTSNVMEMTDLRDRTFDAIVSFETIEHIDQPLVFLGNVRRVLKPDGVLIISTPNKWGLTKDHKVDYDYALLRSHLEQFFTIEDMFVQNSGSLDLWINRGQPRRLEKATADTIEQAECFIAVCRNNKGGA